MRSCPNVARLLAALALIMLLASTPRVVSGQVAWFIEAIEEGTFVGTAMGLALDTSNRPHVSFFDVQRGSVRYAEKVTGAWQVETVEILPRYVIGPTNIKLDSTGRPHLSYCDGVQLRYAHRSGSLWNITSVDRCYIEGANDLAIARDGSTRFAYAGYNGLLRFATWNGSGWAKVTVDEETVIARYVSLALDEADLPHVTYSGNGNLRHAVLAHTGWVVEIVDPEDRSGFYGRLALDARGWPRIAYYGSRDRELKLASWDGTERTWALDVIDSDGDAGWDIGLATDRRGRLHISYYERLTGDLRYSLKDGSTLIRQTVDSSGVVGWYTSIAVSSSGFALIAYFDWSDSALRLAVSRLELQVRTLSATALGLDRATLKGELTSLGYLTETNVYFEWRSASGGPWNRTIPLRMFSPGPFSADLANLTPGGTHEARAVAEGGGSPAYGEVVRFEASTPPPSQFPWLETAIALASVVIVVASAVLVRWRKRSA